MQLTQSKKEVIKASATLVALTIGAGVLALPYIVARIGIIFGIGLIMGIGLITLFINLILGQVSLKTWGNHQLTGYAEQHLGKKGKFFMGIAMIIGQYSALIAYLIGISTILSSLLWGDKLFYGVILISIMFVILSYGIRVFERIEMILIGGMILLIFLLPFFLKGQLSFLNLEQISSFSWTGLLASYGAILFAYSGLQSIPIMKLQIKENKNLKKAIIIGSLAIIGIYSLFTLIILMAIRLEDFEMYKEKIATIVLEGTIEGATTFLLNIFALLTMLSSFVAISFVLYQMYRKDYRIKKEFSTFFTIFVPLFIFILYITEGITSFIDSLDFGGIFSTGIVMILVILMSWSIERKRIKRKRKIKHKIIYWIKTIVSWIILLLVLTGLFLKLKEMLVG